MRAWIHSIEKGRRVRTRAIFARNGIAVVPSLDRERRWTIAHQPTGKKFPCVSPLLKRRQAVALAETMAALGDWSSIRDNAPRPEAALCLTAAETVAAMFGALW